MEIKELSNAEFNSFTDSFPYFSIYQTSEYGFIMNTQNYESLFLGLVDENKILAATLLLVEKKSMFKYAYAPKGFLIDYNNKELVENFTNLIKEYLGKKKIIAVKINPMIIKSSYDYKTNMAHINPKFEEQLEFLKSIGYYHLGFNNLFESFKPRYDAIIDLNKPLNRIFNNINIKFKKKVKSADSAGVRIVKASDKDIDYIYEQVKDKYPRDKKYFEDVFFFLKKRNLVDYYYAKLDTNAYLIYIQKKYQKQMNICNKINSKLFKRTGKNNNKIINNKINEEKYLNELKNELVYATNLLKEKPNGVILATMIITKYRNEAYILIDGFNKEFKKINAKHLMTWKLIEKYSKEKFSRFNLGGMTNPNIKSEKYNGLNEFKLSFDARCVEYIGDLELITNPTLYTIYRNSKSIRYILKKDKKN